MRGVRRRAQNAAIAKRKRSWRRLARKAARHDLNVCREIHDEVSASDYHKRLRNLQKQLNFGQIYGSRGMGKTAFMKEFVAAHPGTKVLTFDSEAKLDKSWLKHFGVQPKNPMFDLLEDYVPRTPLRNMSVDIDSLLLDAAGKSAAPAGAQRMDDCARGGHEMVPRPSDDFEAGEDAYEACQPVGNCPKCGVPVYTKEGFCGGCNP